MDLGAQPVMLLLLLQGTSTNHHNLIQEKLFSFRAVKSVNYMHSMYF